MAKAPKAKANYRPGSPAKRCADCSMFQPPSACSAVKGKISPQGLCDYFEKAPSNRRKAWYGDSYGGKSKD